jgi:parvulin-like peptidyl-prolyl isomerase
MWYPEKVFEFVILMMQKGNGMMKKLILFLGISIAILPLSASATEIDRVVAVVGSNAVTLSELQGEMAPALNELNQKYAGDELARATDKLKRAMLNNLVDKYLQLQEAKVQGVEVSKEEVDGAISDIMKKNHMESDAFAAALAGEGFTLDDYKKTLTDQLVIIRLVNHTVKSKISVKESDIADYYSSNKERFAQPESVRVANISFPAPEGDMDKALKNAQDARASIVAGAPFEEMAAKCTGDPNAAKTCVLGSFTRGELSSDIEERAFKMSAGEVSEPLKTDKGYQLIKVMEKTQAGIKPLSEVRQQVLDELSTKQGEVLFAKWVQELRKHTYVEIREF